MVCQICHIWSLYWAKTLNNILEVIQDQFGEAFPINCSSPNISPISQRYIVRVPRPNGAKFTSHPKNLRYSGPEMEISSFKGKYLNKQSLNMVNSRWIYVSNAGLVCSSCPYYWGTRNTHWYEWRARGWNAGSYTLLALTRRSAPAQEFAGFIIFLQVWVWEIFCYDVSLVWFCQTLIVKWTFSNSSLLNMDKERMTFLVTSAANDIRLIFSCSDFLIKTAVLWYDYSFNRETDVI